jgi:hypothetical protein
MKAEHGLDPLDELELVMLIEEAGLELDTDQVKRLKPYLVSPRTFSARSGQWQAPMVVFARRGDLALALDEDGPQVAFGRVEDNRTLRVIRRPRSVELSIRYLLSSDGS